MNRDDKAGCDRGGEERKDGERVGGGWCRWYAGWRARRVRGEEVLQGVGGFLLLPRGKGGLQSGGYRAGAGVGGERRGG